ncbi:MAG: hypothetical protein HF976_10575 [ANME-2 cluster archaeon]|nr:hypothetical protein [ANME-2 cluster archaeon]MBC2701834.1 hypothetical protein [ANME-2 cluster archaeon]MBC2706722.1 hypothetical protein [ANME-2 cluster archaeon]MBC2747956.1 hypothetical protein [ANME-2 cluster archaeon]
MAANVARQNDENLGTYYYGKIENGKHHKSALNALAAKLFRIVYWVIDKEYKVQ